MSIRYALVIDTEQYAGNFERQLCAFVTGQIGDCGVGDDYASLYHEPEEFENIEQRADEDDGCRRPCSIWITPNRPSEPYSSVAIFFHEQPTEKQIALIKSRAGQFNAAHAQLKAYGGPIAITGFRLVTITQSEESRAV